MDHSNEKSGALPGAQQKYLATRSEDGRYVVIDHVNSYPIPSWPVRIRDPKPLAEFKNEDGPPSIVDTLIAGLRGGADEDLRRLNRDKITADDAGKP